MENIASHGRITVVISSSGVERVSIEAVNEVQESKARATYEQIRPLLDQIDKELRGSYGPQG